jgi:hypothetical protein
MNFLDIRRDNVKKLILFIFLLAIPFCKAADPDQAAWDAAEQGQWDRVLELMDEGVDVNVRPFIHEAVKQRNLEITKALLNRGSEFFLALRLVSNRYLNKGSSLDFEIVKDLLEYRADPFQADRFGVLYNAIASIEAPKGSDKAKRRDRLIDLFKEYADVTLKPAKN